MGCSASSVIPLQAKDRLKKDLRPGLKPLMINQMIQKDDPDISPLATRHFTYISEDELEKLQELSESKHLDEVRKIATLDFDNLDFSGQTQRDLPQRVRPQLPNLEDLDHSIQVENHQAKRVMPSVGQEGKTAAVRPEKVTNIADLLEQSPKAKLDSSESSGSAELHYAQKNHPKLQLRRDLGEIGSKQLSDDRVPFETSGSPSKYSIIPQFQEQDSENPFPYEKSRMGSKPEAPGHLPLKLPQISGGANFEVLRDKFELSPIMEKPSQSSGRMPSAVVSPKNSPNLDTASQPKAGANLSVGKNDLTPQNLPVRGQTGSKHRSYTVLPSSAKLKLPLTTTQKKFAAVVMEAMRTHLAQRKNELTPSRALQIGLGRQIQRTQSVNPRELASHLAKVARKSSFANESQQQSSQPPLALVERKEPPPRRFESAPQTPILRMTESANFQSSPLKPEPDPKPLALKDHKRKTNFRTIKAPSLLADLRHK